MSRKAVWRKFFTLVELLVAIAVIAILAALLFPSLMTVKAKVRALQCLGNMKQVGVAQYLYAGDWGGVFTPVYCGQAWYRCLETYLPRRTSTYLGYRPNRAMICPEAPYAYKGGFGLDLLQTTYGATHALLFKQRNQHYNYGAAALPMPLANYERPSASLLFYDGCQQPGASYYPYCYSYCTASNLPPNSAWQNFIGFRHSDKICGSYVDGHTGTLHLSDINRNMWSDYWP